MAQKSTKIISVALCVYSCGHLYGLTSAGFYKRDPLRYVRTPLMTQRLLGIRKLTLGWPVYAFGAECLGQVMMYPDGHAPGSDPGRPLVNRANWRELDIPDLEGEIPRIMEEMLHHFANLTGLDPVAHLPGPYSLAADIFGQEALISALINAPEFVAEFLDHLVDRVFVPWIERLICTTFRGFGSNFPTHPDRSCLSAQASL